MVNKEFITQNLIVQVQSFMFYLECYHKLCRDNNADLTHDPLVNELNVPGLIEEIAPMKVQPELF